MKKIVLSVILFSNFLGAQTDFYTETPFCKLEYYVNTDIINVDDTFTLTVINKEKYKLRVNKSFPEILIQISKLAKYNNYSKTYSLINPSIADVQMLASGEKYTNLKPNQSIIYKLNLKNLPLVYKYIAEQKTSYKFSLWFETHMLLDYKNRKCYSRNFTSPEINYTSQ